MKNFVLTLLLIGYYTSSLIAQTAQHPWGVGLSINPKEYYGTLGSSAFQFKNLNLSPGIQVSRYLDNYVDLSLHANFGRMIFEPENKETFPGFNTKLTDIGLDMIFKLNNGEYIKEDALIQPYGIISIGTCLYKSGTFDNPDSIISKGAFLNLGGGLGFRIRLTEMLHLGYNMTFNANFNENYDYQQGAKSYDGFLKHSLALTYSFGRGNMVEDKTRDTDGDGVPDYMDKCAMTYPGLRVDKHGCPRELTVEERELKMISDKVFFEFDSATLKEESKADLDKLVQYLNDRKWIQLSIEGHTDVKGDGVYNQILSERRAVAVKDYLVSKGIDGSKISTIGYGQKLPIASNDTEEGRALNRRVEFRLSR
jgi:outer membrane protein OmpA-like peptidoglycan-associated protein